MDWKVQQGANKAVCSKNPAAQWLLGSIALPILLWVHNQTSQGCEAFNDVGLASHILRMVPRNWQDQYKHTGAIVPQSVHKLLKVLEHIEKAFPTKKECIGPWASVKGGSSSKK